MIQAKEISKIIKKDKVKLNGSYSISLDGKPDQTKKQQASAKIVEATDTYATIELTCPCGKISRIRCNYS